MKLIKLVPIFGVALFIYILANLDLAKVISIFSSLDPLYIILALLMQVPIIVIKAVKWKVLIRPFNRKFPLAEAVKAWLIGFSIGIVTPGRMGDFTRACYLRDRLDFGKSLMTVVFDRIIDVLVLFILTIIGIVMFASFVSTGISNEIFTLLIMALFIAFLGGIYLMTKKALVSRIFGPFYRLLVPKKYSKRARKAFDDFYKGLDAMGRDKRVIALSTGIGVIAWVFMIIQTYILSLAMETGLSLLVIASIMPLITLLDALPISFSGVGTRDAAMIFLFSLMSLSAEAAVSFSLLILVFNYLTSAAFGYFFWFRNPIDLSPRRSDRH